MAVNNNLFPPIIDSYMPAFLQKKDGKCRVYFSISSFNTMEDISKDLVQVTVTNQLTNTTALDKNLYPSEIILKTLGVDNTRLTDDKYFIDIYNTDLRGGDFELNQYYKVQIRFTSSSIKNAPEATSSGR